MFQELALPPRPSPTPVVRVREPEQLRLQGAVRECAIGELGPIDLERGVAERLKGLARTGAEHEQDSRAQDGELALEVARRALPPHCRRRLTGAAPARRALDRLHTRDVLEEADERSRVG